MKFSLKKLNIFIKKFQYVEVYKFIFIGILIVSIDALFYYLLTFLDLTSFQVSKRISFVIGAIFAFVLNRNYVFFYNKRNLSQFFYFIGLYFTSFIINTLTHDYIFMISNIPLISFLIATLISATLNFIGMKFFIFKK